MHKHNYDISDLKVLTTPEDKEVGEDMDARHLKEVGTITMAYGEDEAFAAAEALAVKYPWILFQVLNERHRKLSTTIDCMRDCMSEVYR